ncbi:hypothetical protein, partial [Bradyrhizobium sp.]|uniref:hypothetical protein n=1 Tax=Bradyrhizobium sp. TaxID=376 RepID=UPI002391E1D8
QPVRQRRAGEIPDRADRQGLSARRSSRHVSVELRERFDPPQGVALAILVEARDLLRDSSPNAMRPRIDNDQAQTLSAPSLPHLRPFGPCGHGIFHP